MYVYTSNIKHANNENHDNQAASPVQLLLGDSGGIRY